MMNIFQQASAERVSGQYGVWTETRVHNAGSMIMVFDFRRKEEQRMYLRKNGEEMAPARSLPVSEPAENAVNFPLTATVTVSKSEWEELILANDRMNRELERIKFYLRNEASKNEVFVSIETAMMILDMTLDALYADNKKIMP